ncbi:hypothetical protein LK540_06565 [Massilia sp. IC2-278]|uniref:hypothetical protein n=1 Tax=Massilia sp. IC2-278 TaxID=2887200 RepID=UPI001E2BAF26|nr:hypothetical protein [Massilia sp. IC2-278]MCC2960090.1 hypothetical protein [Massilia sp. IC2-278]
MTTAIASPGALPGPLKGGLLAAGVFAACWGGAIWYWRGATGTPGTLELMLVLLALPLMLVGSMWFGGKLLAKRAAAAPAAAAVMTAPAPVAALPALAIVSSALRSPYGASAEELAEAIAGNTVRPDLDAELIDDDGFPVAAARCSDALDPSLQEEVGAWLVQNGMPELHFTDPQWRALTLGSSVVAELASRAGDLLPAEGKPPSLRLLPLLPADWTLEQRRAAGMWFQHIAASFGWPAAQVALPDASAEAITPAALCTQLASEAAKETAPVVALLVACASNIGQDIVDEWASKGILFTSGRPQGLVPGEGAAGLLLTDLRLAHAIDGTLFVLLDPAEEAQREAAAPARQRAQPALLGELAGRAGRHAAAGLAEVAMVVADSGQRQTRTLELMGMVSNAMPGLDENEDVFCVGSASGACGDVPFVTALALAQHGALVRGAPVLCLGNEDAAHCSAHLLRPPPPEARAS